MKPWAMRAVCGVSLAAFAAAAVAYARLVPPWEYPDENHHVERALFEADGHEWPPLYGPGESGAIRCAFYPPLYYTVASRLVRPSPGARPSDFVKYRPDGTRQFSVQNSADPVYVRMTEDLARLRWLGIVLGLVTAAATAWTVRSAMPDWPSAPPLAILLLASIPQVPFMAAGANPEGLANACCALAVALIADGWRIERWSGWRVGAIGALLGAAVLSKTLALFWIPLLPVLMVCRPVPRSWRRVARETLLAELLLGLVIAPWIAWTALDQGDLLARRCAMAASGPDWQPPPFGVRTLAVAVARLGATGWASIGYFAVYGRVWMFATAAALFGAVLAGLLAVWRAGGIARGWLVLGGWICLANLGLVLAYNMQVWSPQGRYLFLSLAPAVMLVLLAASRMRLGRRTVMSVLGVGLLLFEHLVFLAGHVGPAYGR
ncbi:MAG: hypothetical protein HYY93_11905 [Planctomycetes bacterium]|nr:hypothetical protein [Planctomycetota bacterium]